MRFIFNFIFFGILFYLIYVFFPDAFHTLVSWVQAVYEFLRDITMRIVERFRTEAPKETHPEPTKALFLFLISRFKNLK